VTGLATMGRNLARNLARHGYRVALHNRTQARVDDLVAQFGAEGDFVPSSSLEEFVGALCTPRVVVISVAAGAATDAVIDALAPRLESGDIVVDTGNAHFLDTERRGAALEQCGIHFVGTGVSGGEQGALEGPSIMPGGSDEAYEVIGPLLETIAANVDGMPCCFHVGTGAAGHFVKMVHNGIEYCDMQLIAECYDLLREVLQLRPADVAEVFARWNQGDLESYLLEIAAQVLAHVDPETGMPFVDVVLDEAEQKGTGRWTVQNALELGVPVTGIAEATFARSLSGRVEQRTAVRRRFTDRVDTRTTEGDEFVDEVRTTLYAAKIVAYAQGFDQIDAGAAQYGWDIDGAKLAAIWRGGCIIRARLLEQIRDAFASEPGLPTLLVSSYFADVISSSVESWRRVVATATTAGVPTPALSSTLASFEGLRRTRLPASLVQAMRDNFGAHSYRRRDKSGTFHTTWTSASARELRVESEPRRA
jgi:6-phosphogluconate dehydrogenase